MTRGGHAASASRCPCSTIRATSAPVNDRASMGRIVAGRIVVTAGDDGVIYLYDTATMIDVGRIPGGAFLSGLVFAPDGTGKWLVRRAIEGVVPKSVLEHPKQGFAVPLGAWFRHELAHRVQRLSSPGARIHEFTDVNAVRRLAAEHRIGRRDHSWMLWRAMVLDIWLDCLEKGVLSRPSPGMDMFADSVPARAAAS